MHNKRKYSNGKPFGTGTNPKERTELEDSFIKALEIEIAC